MRTAIFFTLLVTAASSGLSAATKTGYAFRSARQPGQIDHVAIDLKAAGQTQFADDGKPGHEELSLRCKLEYDEKTLDFAARGDGACRSVRRYRKAAAVSTVGGEEFRPSLRSALRLICAEAHGPTVLLFAPAGALNRSELDLIEVQADSLLLDRLLPARRVVLGDQWPHRKQLLAALLGLDEVSKADVQSRLKEVTDIVARFEIHGHVEGAVHGAPTQIDLKGKYRFDLRSRRIDWLGLLIKEKRQSSLVADGLEVHSVLQVTVHPLAHAADLSAATLAKVAAQVRASPESTRLSYHSASGHWQFVYDRRWYVFRDQPEVAVLRLLDRGEVIAQCNVSSLPDRPADQLVGLSEFQDDVRRALDKDFGGFVEASQRVDPSEHRILRVVAEGKHSEIPIQWIYYHVADRQGRQVAFTFTVEKGLLDRFEDADQLFVRSLRFDRPPAATK